MKSLDRTLAFRKVSNLIIITFSFLLFSLFLNNVSADPGIFYVKWDATGANTGTSWDDAFTDLQDALVSAVSGDEIWVAAGVYKPTSVSTDRSATFQLIEEVAVYGGFNGVETILDERDPEKNVTILSGDIDNNDSQAPIITDITTLTGNTTNSYHVVTGANDATLDGFTITAGSANSSTDPNNCGGGMYNYASSLALRNVTFVGNIAYVIYEGGVGGGMYNYASNLTLFDVTFNNNSADLNGGGLFCEASNVTLNHVFFSDNIVENNGGGMCFIGYPSIATLTDVNFTNNSAISGGGLYASSETKLKNVVFDSNYADSGGGMYLSSESILEDVTFSNNTATTGGGLYNSSSSEFSRITFNGNSATGGGGGMWSFISSPKLTDITFINNSTDNTGGGLIYLGDPILNNITFISNFAGVDGGGLVNSMGFNGKLTNMTFIGNIASSNGGGMFSEGGNPTLTNITMIDNSAGGSGGGIYTSLDGSPSLRNMVVWNNIAPVGAQMYSESESCPSIFYSVIEGGCPLGSTCYETIADDPLLGSLGDYGGFTQTIPLLEGSSAINTADNDVCPETDQRGVFRPQYSYCDIGAFENNTIAPTVVNSIRVDDNPTNLSSVIFAVTFSDSVTGVDISDFLLSTTGISDASISEASGSGSEYSVVVNTGTGDGTIRLDVIDDDSIINAELDPLGAVGIGNGDFSRGEIYTIDKTYPIVQSSVRKNSNPTKAEAVTFTVSFSEPVTGVDITDFSVLAPDLSDTSVESISGSGSTYDVILNTGSGTGSLELIVIDDDSIMDGVGNMLGGEGLGNGNYNEGEAYSVDRTPPTVLSMICANANPSNSNTVYYIVTFSEPVFVDLTDFSLIVNGISNVSIANVYPGSRYSDVHTVTINTGVGNGTIQLNLIDDDTIRDFIGHQLGGEGIGNGNFSGEVYTIDRIPPVVVSSAQVGESPTNADEVDFTVTFSEDVKGVSISDFSLTTDGITGASIINVVGENSEYTVTVSTGTGSGTIQLNVQDDDSIKDYALNPLGGEGEGNGSYYDGDTYKIIGTQYIIFMPLINK